ncbi:MBL fold metallo-hydrolase [Halegenticoccus tardaugens]|uniref:MBL fold metallo-hydrolase n=1 Tax=Halegenticoccus tardaugens TaxID=2071624 RepID=UPI00100A44A0|nr:MBL fold metallo-hydrolase [Halegenticoccus tardaugens]
MTVSLTDSITWLNESIAHGDLNEHVSVYLIETESGNIVVDSGSVHHRESISEQLQDATDDEGLDAIILSHSDYPHSGNIGEFRERWGGVELIASSGSPEIQGLQDATKCTIGESMDVLGRTFSFIDPPLADRSHTTWIYDHVSGVLFTADGFGNYHRPKEEDYTSADFDDVTPFEQIYRYHRDNLVWLRYVDPEKLHEALDAAFDQFEISYIAPIHGNPIVGSDRDTYLDRLIRASDRIASEYVVA